MVTKISSIKIEVICLIMVIILCIAIYVNGKDLDCSKCIIKFKAVKHKIPGRDGFYSTMNMSVKELYDSYIQNKCVLTLDYNGYQVDR